MSKMSIDKLAILVYDVSVRRIAIMKKQITLEIDENILVRFNMALQLNNETCDNVCETFMKRYFMDSFSKEANSYFPTTVSAPTRQCVENSFYGKALKRIAKWASKPNQINYKILRAYLQLSDEIEFVSYENLMLRCNDEDKHTDVYVPTFATNFAQMKFDGEKSHGKVFVVNENGTVSLWDYVEDEVMKYKSEFLKLLPTDKGYINRNNQMNLGKTELDGTDHMQKLYMMKCLECGSEYFANGTNIYEKKCPKCSGGVDTGFAKKHE